MKTEWQSGKGMNTGCGGAVIKHFPHPFAFEGFWETVPAICAPPKFSDASCWAVTWAFTQPHPMLLIYCYRWLSLVE